MVCACVPVHVHVSVCACIHACEQMDVCVHVCVSVRVCLSMHACVFVYMCHIMCCGLCVSVCHCACMHPFVPIHACVHMCTCTTGSVNGNNISSFVSCLLRMRQRQISLCMFGMDKKPKKHDTLMCTAVCRQLTCAVEYQDDVQNPQSSICNRSKSSYKSNDKTRSCC